MTGADPPRKPALKLQGVHKNYGSVVAVGGVDLVVDEGEFFTLLGPSGSGKTTLLRLIAGFERPDAGRIELGGRDVTHDQEEALTMSDRVAVMSNGQIEQIGSPVDVYEKPATEFVAGFIGISNVLARDGVRFVIRPEKIRMLAEGDESRPGMTVEPGRVEEVIYVGTSTRYLVRLDRGEQLVAVRQNMDALGDAQRFEGRPVRLAWTPEHTFVLDKGR